MERRPCPERNDLDTAEHRDMLGGGEARASRAASPAASARSWGTGDIISLDDLADGGRIRVGKFKPVAASAGLGNCCDASD